MYRGPPRGPCIGSIYTHPSRVGGIKLLLSSYNYEVLNLNTNISRSGSPVCKRWLILNAPLLKNNCNGALSPSSHSGVLGFVTRVMEGQAIAGVLGDAPNHIMLTMLILHLQASR